MAEDKYDAPTETLGDTLHTATLAGLSAIPIIGGAISELFQLVFAAPFRKRQRKWMEDIAEVIRRIEEHLRMVDSSAFNVKDLANNDQFIDTTIQASQAAMRTRHEEKLKALRNAVFNAALPNAPTTTMQSMFVIFIDTFTPLHLQLLSLLDDPHVWFTTHERNPPQRQREARLWAVVAAAHPELENQEAICERVCKDLYEKGLLIAPSLRKHVTRFPYFPGRPREEQPGYRFADELPADGTVSPSGEPTVMRNWTTELGREFLAFIRSPLVFHRSLVFG